MSQSEETAETTGDISITCVFYERAGSQEADEYVEIRNGGSVVVQLENWTLRDEPSQVFAFPNDVMEPRQVCRVYTSEYHPEWCGLSCISGSAIWSNGVIVGTCGVCRVIQSISTATGPGFLQSTTALRFVSSRSMMRTQKPRDLTSPRL